MRAMKTTTTRATTRATTRVVARDGAARRGRARGVGRDAAARRRRAATTRANGDDDDATDAARDDDDATDKASLATEDVLQFREVCAQARAFAATTRGRRAASGTTLAATSDEARARLARTRACFGAGTKYIAVCSPAFHPLLAHREEGSSADAAKCAPPPHDKHTDVYHLVQKPLWEEVTSGAKVCGGVHGLLGHRSIVASAVNVLRPSLDNAVLIRNASPAVRRIEYAYPGCQGSRVY